MQSPGKIPALQGLSFVESLLKVSIPGELLPDSWALRKPQSLIISWTPAINLLQSHIDKNKKKSRGIGWHSSVRLKFFPSEGWQLINLIWLQSILNGQSFFLIRNRLFVILNHVNSQNKTLFQLTLHLLSFRHIEISHLTILQIPANILSKHSAISR